MLFFPWSFLLSHTLSHIWQELPSSFVSSSTIFFLSFILCYLPPFFPPLLSFSFLFSSTIRIQRVSGHSFLQGKDITDELAWLKALLQPFTFPCNLSLLLPIVSTFPFSRAGCVLSHLNSLTHSSPQYSLRSLCSRSFYPLPSLLQRVQPSVKCLSLYI